MTRFFGQALVICGVLLGGCWSHYGVEVIAHAPVWTAVVTRAPLETNAVIELVSKLADDLGMQRREPPNIPGNGEMVAFFQGPWGAASWEKSASKMQLSVWRNHDGSVSVWIVDWGEFGLSDRLQSLRDRVMAGLEERFPDHEIRIEVQKLGFWSP